MPGLKRLIYNIIKKQLSLLYYEMYQLSFVLPHSFLWLPVVKRRNTLYLRIIVDAVIIALVLKGKGKEC